MNRFKQIAIRADKKIMHNKIKPNSLKFLNQILLSL